VGRSTLFSDERLRPVEGAARAGVAPRCTYDSDVPKLVESSDAARGLADHVLDPGRERPIVCVSVPRRDSKPLVDVEEMEAAVGHVADVWVVRTGDATWELAHRLPVGLDVYDGAVRVWWPSLDETGDRFAHPLFFGSPCISVDHLG
jgi:hypothetical protein